MGSKDGCQLMMFRRVIGIKDEHQLTVSAKESAVGSARSASNILRSLL